LLLCIFISSVACITPQKTIAQISVNFQVFYDDLSPYGTWINTEEYGYAWMPDVADDFMPYNTNGYWIYTDAGWTWVSDYSWGWAPFHYGRWYYDSEYGNMWVPGNEWGPGWVSWRQSEGYYGWAPIGPGISIDMAYGNNYNIPYDRWTFVKNNNFGRSNINRYYMNRSNNNTIYNHSTVINNMQSNRENNARYNGGPDRDDVQKRTGRQINSIPVRSNNTPGQQVSKSEYKVYKPKIEQNNDGGQKPVPAQVKNIKEMRTIKNRNDVNTGTQNNPQQSKPQPDKQNQPQPNQQPQQQTKQQPQQERQPNKNQPTPLPAQQPQKQPAWPQQRQQPIPQREPNKQQPRQNQIPQPQQDRQPVRQQPQQRQMPQPQKQQDKQPSQQPQQKQPDRQQPRQQFPKQQQQQQQQQPNRQPGKENHDNRPHKKESAL
jgi:hypothetical protein